MKSVIALSLAALALAAPPKPKPIDVTVARVNDHRTSGSFAELIIVLELPKVRAADVAASRVLLTSAVDDTGRDLIDHSEHEPSLDPSQSMARDDSPARIEVKLKNPARKAKNVREVTGEVELFMPSKDPTSTAEIPRFLSLTGKPLSDRALSANGVEITLLTPAQVEAEKKRLAEAQRKEAAANGLSGEALEAFVKDFFGSLFGEENQVLARVKDPNKRIQQVAYIDSSGELKHVTVRDDHGLTSFMMWGEKPAPDWKLRISMRTPKNIVRYGFRVAEVGLP